MTGSHGDRPAARAHKALAWLRVTVALLLFAHGVARVANGIVDDFGVFLTEQGLPMGGVVAWLLTVVELLGGALLASGRLVRLLASWFAAQLVVGIVLVHFPEGWFVVGVGRNGMEYSVLLVISLLLVAWTAPRHTRRRPAAN